MDMQTEPDLQRLVLDAKGTRSFERMSKDCGGKPTDKRLQQLATEPIKKFPDRVTIEGLARGTGTTVTAVVLAAARSLGLSVHNGDDPGALIIGGGAHLRGEQKEALLDLARSFRAANEAEAHERMATARRLAEDARDSLVRLIEHPPGSPDDFLAALLSFRPPVGELHWIASRPDLAVSVETSDLDELERLNHESTELVRGLAKTIETERLRRERARLAVAAMEESLGGTPPGQSEESDA